MQNLKFWVYVNGSPVRITLCPGQTVEHCTGGPDSEGWHRSSILWKHAGHGIYSEGLTEGRDCDGYVSRWFDCFCPAEELTAGSEVDGVVFPRWGDATEETRDDYAEAAGY
jgi:hypothetical protein